MSTLPTAAPFDPNSTDKLSIGTLGYIRARNKNAFYNLVVGEFKKSGLTQAQLAKRIGRTADVVCRLLGRPSNMEIDTASDLLFGICGATLKLGVQHPRTATVAHSPSITATQTTTTPTSRLVAVGPQGQTEASARFEMFYQAAA